MTARWLALFLCAPLAEFGEVPSVMGLSKVRGAKRLVLRYGATLALRMQSGGFLRANAHYGSNGRSATPPYYWQQFTVLPVKGVTIKHANLQVRFGDRLSLRNSDGEWIQAQSHEWQTWPWGSKRVFDDWTEDLTVTWMGFSKGWVRDGAMVGFHARNGMWLQEPHRPIKASKLGDQKSYQTFTVVCVRGCVVLRDPTPVPTPAPSPAPSPSVLDPALCALTLWGAWEPCTASCGGGTTTRKRKSKNDHLSIFHDLGLSQPCPTLSQSQKCNAFTCAALGPPSATCDAGVMCQLKKNRFGVMQPHIINKGKAKLPGLSFRCSIHKAVGPEPLKHVHKVKIRSPCAVLQHYFGGNCANIHKHAGKGSGFEVYGFKLTSAHGLMYREKSFDAHMVAAGSNNVRNACLLALYGSGGKFRWTPNKSSFAAARGVPTQYWFGGCAPGGSCNRCLNTDLLQAGQRFDFTSGSSCGGSDDTSMAWTQLTCLWNEGTPFEFAGSEGETHTLGATAACSCSCTERPCCSREGFTLINPKMPDMHLKNERTKEECCRKCAKVHGCTSWTFGGGNWAQHERPSCTLFSGDPIYIPSVLTNFQERTLFAGAPPGLHCLVRRR